MKKIIQLFFRLIPTSLLFGTAIAQTPTLPRVPIAATGVSLQKPAGFENAEAFHGFQQDSTGASVLVTLIPGPYAEVSKGLTKEGLAARGIQLLSKQPMTIADQPGLLLHLSQDGYGQTFKKWLAVFGDSTATRMVTATFPEDQAENLSDSLRTVVLSSMLSDSSQDAAPLPFEIGTVEGLTRVKKLAGIGKVAAFSKTGQLPAASPSEPLFIVAPSLGEVPILDPKSFAVQRLDQTPNTENIRVEKVSEINIDGLSGFEIEAVGRDQESDQELMLYQVVLYPSDGGYVAMQGLVGAQEGESYLMKFQSLARTYRAIED